MVSVNLKSLLRAAVSVCQLSSSV